MHVLSTASLTEGWGGKERGRAQKAVGESFPKEPALPSWVPLPSLPHRCRRSCSRVLGAGRGLQE